MDTTEYLEERTQDLNELMEMLAAGRVKKMVVTVLDDQDQVHQMEVRSPAIRELG